MSPAELNPGYEQAFTVTQYKDGPLQGIANFKGQPHFYERIFDEAQGEYSDDFYRLTPISRQVFDLAIESWAIWQRWSQRSTRVEQLLIPTQLCIAIDRGTKK